MAYFDDSDYFRRAAAYFGDDGQDSPVEDPYGSVLRARYGRTGASSGHSGYGTGAGTGAGSSGSPFTAGSFAERSANRKAGQTDLARAVGMSEQDASGEKPDGLLTWALDKLQRPASAGAALAMDNLGFDPQTGDWDWRELGGAATDAVRAAGHLVRGEGREALEEFDGMRGVARGLAGEEVTWQDAAPFRKDDDDQWFTRAAKSTGGFLADVATDPLTFLTAGGASVSRKAGAQLLESQVRRTAAGKLDEASTGALAGRYVKRDPVDGLTDDAAEKALEAGEAGAAEAAQATGRRTPGKPVELDQAGQALDVLATEAAEAYALGGSRGVREYLASADVPEELREELWESLPRDLKGGLRFAAPFVKDENGVQRAWGVGGGGQLVDAVGLGGVARKANDARNRLRATRGVSKVADNLGGRRGREYGAMIRGAVRTPEDANRVRYAHLSRLAEVDRDHAAFAGDLAKAGNEAMMAAEAFVKGEGESGVSEAAARKAVQRYFTDPDAVLPASADASERAGFEAAARLRDSYAEMHAAATGEGMDVGHINAYVNRILTEDYAKLQRSRKAGRSGAGAGGAAPMKHRAAWFTVETATDGTLVPRWLGLDEINEATRKTHGIDAVETDPFKLAAAYHSAMARAVSEKRLVNRLREQGLAFADTPKVVGGFDLFTAGNVIQGVRGRLAAEADDHEAWRRGKSAHRHGKLAAQAERTAARVDDLLASADDLARQADELETGDDLFTGASSPAVQQLRRESARARLTATDLDARLNRQADDATAARAALDADNETAAAIAADRAAIDAFVADDDAVASYLNNLPRDPAEAQSHVADLVNAMRRSLSNQRDRVKARAEDGTASEKQAEWLDAEHRRLDELVGRLASGDWASPNQFGEYQASDLALRLTGTGWERVGTGVEGQLRASENFTDLYTVPALREAVESYVKVRPSSKFIDEAYAPMLAMWKGWATVGRGPGYHVRNMVGATWNNHLFGVQGADYKASATIDMLAWQARKEAAEELGVDLKLLDTVTGRRRALLEERGQQIWREKLASYDVENALVGRDRNKALVGEGGKHVTLLDVVDAYDAQGLGRSVMLTENLTRGGIRDGSTALEEASRGRGYRDYFPNTRPEDQNLAQRAGNKAMNNWWMHTSGSVAQGTEDYFRRAAFVNGIRKHGLGDGGNAAAVQVKLAQFDYSDLSDFEQRWMRNLIPFYSWTRNNVPLQLRALAFAPGKINTLTRAHEVVADNLTYDTDGDGVDDAGIPWDELTPAWAKDRFEFTSRFTTGDGAPIGVGLENPITDLNRWFVASSDPADWVDQFKTQTVGQLNPFVKAASEAMTGYDTGTGGMNNPDQLASNWMTGFGVADDNPLTRRNTDGELLARYGWMETIAPDLLPPLGQVKRLVPFGQDERSAGRIGTSWLSQGAGLPVSTRTEDQLGGELAARYERTDPKLEERMVELGVDPDWVKDAVDAWGPEATWQRILAGQGRTKP